MTCERGEAVDYDRELLEDESESGVEEDEVRVATIKRLKISRMSGGMVALIMRTL